MKYLGVVALAERELQRAIFPEVYQEKCLSDVYDKQACRECVIRNGTHKADANGVCDSLHGEIDSRKGTFDSWAAFEPCDNLGTFRTKNSVKPFPNPSHIPVKISSKFSDASRKFIEKKLKEWEQKTGCLNFVTNSKQPPQLVYELNTKWPDSKCNATALGYSGKVNPTTVTLNKNFMKDTCVDHENAHAIGAGAHCQSRTERDKDWRLSCQAQIVQPHNYGKLDPGDHVDPGLSPDNDILCYPCFQHVMPRLKGTSPHSKELDSYFQRCAAIQKARLGGLVREHFETAKKFPLPCRKLKLGRCDAINACCRIRCPVDLCMGAVN